MHVDQRQFKDMAQVVTLFFSIPWKFKNMAVLDPSKFNDILQMELSQCNEMARRDLWQLTEMAQVVLV